MAEKFDIIICGAGPAGCTAALTLGSSGFSTALIEKESFPREKVCGDAIPAYVPKVLNTINPEFARAFENLSGGTRVNTCRIVSPDKNVLDLKWQESGVICRREVFDNFLFSLVSGLPGIKVFSNTRIRKISVNSKEVLIGAENGLEFRSGLVIGCDGANSIIKRNLTNSSIDPRHCSGAVRAYFKNVKNIMPDTFELHFIREYLPGYFWIFPLQDNYSNVGFGMPSYLITARHVSLRKEMEKIIGLDTNISKRFSDAEIDGGIDGGLLPVGSCKTGISGNRFMLCGDAASLADPATGEGIGHAMISGRYAGWHAMKCFEKGDFSSGFMKGYDKTVYDKLWKGNRRRRIIRDYVINNPALFNTCINIAVNSVFIKNLTMRILR